jgi:hypothetical protein
VLSVVGDFVNLEYLPTQSSKMLLRVRNKRYICVYAFEDAPKGSKKGFLRYTIPPCTTG